MTPTAGQPPPSPSANGAAPLPEVPLERTSLEEMLVAQPLTTGYRSSSPLWMYGAQGWLPQIYILRDIEWMIVHPMVRSVLGYYKSGIAGAEFWGGPSPDNNPEGMPISE